MLAYHNDPAVKAKYIARFAAHREADEVIQGTGFENGRGCFVGCTLNEYNYSKFQDELAWPEWLANLADTIFEGLPKSEAAQFGTDILSSVSIGSNLEFVKTPFLISIEIRNLARLEGNSEPYAEECRKAIQGVIDWLKAGIDYESARSAAWSAGAAARSARSAAWSAWSAAESARSAAWSAESAKQTESQLQRDSLLSIIRGLK